MSQDRFSSTSFAVPLRSVPVTTSALRHLNVDVDVDSLSDCTASDIVGPGRTLGGWISGAGRRLENIVGDVARHLERRGNRQSRYNEDTIGGSGAVQALQALRTRSTLSIDVEIDDLPALNDMLCSLSVDLEVLTTSDASLSDQMGPGRTLGNWISKMGRRTEGLIAGSAERLGMGPNALMDRIVTRISIPQSNRHQSHPRQRPRTLTSLVSEVLLVKEWNYAPCDSDSDSVLVRDATSVEACQKLVKFIRSRSPQTRFLATYYILALLCVFPSSQGLFLDLGVLETLQRMHDYLQTLPRRNKERELLLSPARRALFLLSESRVLTAIKSYDELVQFTHMGCPRWDAHLGRATGILIKYATASETHLLATRRLACVDEFGSYLSELASVMTPELTSRWAELSLSPDPLISNFFYGLLTRFCMTCTQVYYDYGWSWRCYLLPILRTYLAPHAGNSPDDLLEQTIDYCIVQSVLWDHLAATLTCEIRGELQRVHGDADTSQPVQSYLYSLVESSLSPFFTLWGAFNREWLFFSQDMDWDSSIIRAIPPRRRRVLCQCLIELASRSTCSFYEIAKVVQRDVDCFDEIASLRPELLEIILLSSEEENDVPRRTGIYQGICVEDDYYIESQGSIQAFRAGEIKYKDREQEYRDTKELRAHVRYLHWIAISELHSFGNRYKPVALEALNETPMIAAMKDKKGRLHIFSVGEGLEIPQCVGSQSVGSLHILMARDREDGTPSYFWESSFANTGDWCCR
ncbi:hypothetical protein JAAARDRAFT_617060 [Jaapia argillacea MUCL 33604]|uniref:Uncharacterized protein n=1 Tax=Jaapia argillacea MUCL 33604 TaxID=933084 RepID=A0A067P480_9AGAM|nr:hypothetical protein JAAARDRAFT_617060 [Jaapia argillacea MUCL 33604]